MLIGTPSWILIYLLEFFKFEFNIDNLYIIRDVVAIICFSILSPGIILNFIKYIKKNSNQNKSRKIFQNFHIHEGFVGLIFIIIAILLFMIRFIMIQYEILKKQLRIYLAIDMILLFLFLFSGSFLVFRDRRDIFKFRFIERRKYNISNTVSETFNPISSESILFFESPRFILYPFGILLSSFSVNLFIHGTDFFPEILFALKHEILVFIGTILCFIAGGMLGIDWYRLFTRIYPTISKDLEEILNKLKSNINS